VDILSCLPLPYDNEIAEVEKSSINNDLELYEQGKLIRLPNTNYNGS